MGRAVGRYGGTALSSCSCWDRFAEFVFPSPTAIPPSRAIHPHLSHPHCTHTRHPDWRTSPPPQSGQDEGWDLGGVAEGWGVDMIIGFGVCSGPKPICHRSGGPASVRVLVRWLDGGVTSPDHCAPSEGHGRA